MDVNLLDLGGSIPFEVRGHAESSEAASANKTAGEDLPGHPKYAELILLACQTQLLGIRRAFENWTVIALKISPRATGPAVGHSPEASVSE